MRRRDLHRTRAKFAADPIIGDDRDLAIHQRQAQLLAMEVRIALVIRVNSHGYVPEHRLRARGRNRQRLAGVLPILSNDRIPDLPEMPLVLVIDNFEIADRSLAAWAPVHDVGAAIDQPLLVELYKSFTNGDGEPLVHGEVFATPVDRRTQALHLAQDRAAIVFAPFPHALDKGVSPHLLPRAALAHNLAFHQHLGSDTGVVRAWNPEHP